MENFIFCVVNIQSNIHLNTNNLHPNKIEFLIYEFLNNLVTSHHCVAESEALHL